MSPLDQITIVLYRPQKLVNIGGVVRAMKNMGLRHLRLVAPEEFDPQDITGIAHRSDDILAAVEIVPDLDAALADTTYVVGTTARRRGAAAPPVSPREIAPDLLARASEGLVALLFGPEGNGLSNAELDRCHTLVSIPTDPAYASLNLAQAVLLLAYELRLAAPLASSTVARSTYPPATSGELETLFSVLEQALWDVQFFKTDHAASMMRTLRNLIHRTTPSTREAALLTAMAREISHYVRRDPRPKAEDPRS
jgi:TrmH family RNA methyltransferase